MSFVVTGSVTLMIRQLPENYESWQFKGSILKDKVSETDVCPTN